MRPMTRWRTVRNRWPNKTTEFAEESVRKRERFHDQGAEDEPIQESKSFFPMSPLSLPFLLPLLSRFASHGAVICFGVFMRTQEGGVHQKVGDMLQVLPSERYNAHKVPGDRSLTCPEPGTYVLHFDNTYSLLQFKNISYTVDVVLPDGHVQSPRSNRGDGRLE